MSQIRTPTEILLIAKLSQPLAFIDVANQQFLKGGAVSSQLPLMISVERLCVQWDYDTNPTDSTLRATSNYLYQLLGKYAIEAQNILNNLAQTPPVVAGPTNQTVNVGQQATFTITVSSTLPFLIQWLQNGSPITGQTGLSYSVTPDSTLYNNTTYSAVVTNAAGATPSADALLFVTNVITGNYFFGDVDYFTDLSNGIDNIPYNGTFNITNASPLVVNFTSGAQNNKYNGIRYPIAQGVKTIWNNTVSNNGVIPDSTYRAVITIGSFLYIISRTAISLDNTSSTITFS